MAVIRKAVFRETEEVTDVLCDMCGKSCRDDMDMNYEGSHLSASWGYCSRKDDTFWDYDFCEDCSDKIMEFIEKCKGSKLLPL